MIETQPTPIPRRVDSGRRARWRIVAAVVMIGACLSIVGAQQWTSSEERKEDQQLQSLTTLHRSSVEYALTRFGELAANVAAFKTVSTDDPEAFRQYVESQRLDWLIGVDNLGYFVQTGSRVRVEHTAPNPTRLPPGHDMFEHPRRRAALLTAVDTGIPAIGPIGAVSVPTDEPNGGSELIELFAAVYTPGPAPTTVEDRRDRHVGWVGVTVDLEDAVSSLGLTEGGVEMVLRFDDTGELIGESSPGAASRIDAADRAARSVIQLTNRPLRMETTFEPGHQGPRAWHEPFLAGLLVTGLAAYAVWVTQHRRSLILQRADAEHERAEVMSSRFFLAVEEAPVGVVVTDKDGNVELSNERIRSLLGAPSGVRPSIFEYVHQDDQSEMMEALQRLTCGTTDRLVTERELVRRNGARLWCRVTASLARDPDGEPAGLIVHVQDIAAERQAAEDLRSRERWFSSIVEHARDLIVLMEVDGTVKWASPWVNHVFGVEADGLVGTSVLGFIHADDRDRVAEAIRRIGSGDVIEVEYRLKNKDGEMMWMESSATNRLDDPDVAAIITVSRDVTQRQRTTQILQHRAAHDSLTGLLNRAEMESRMTAALVESLLDGQEVCFAFIDLDHFKDLNDRLGHLAGDDVLKLVADVIKAEVRQRDLVARIGGDEMVIGLVGSGVEDSVRIIDRIRGRLHEASRQGVAGVDRVGGVTISVGLAAAVPGDTVETLSARADMALYESKRLGRDRLTIYGDLSHAS